MTYEEYKQCAILAIKRYLQNETIDDATIESKYALAIKRLIARAQEMDTVKINGVKSYSTDGQSYNFNDQDPFAITPDVAILLPKKKRFYAW
ncbi:MAG: hypothetical protein LKH93_19790 [Clostridium beijerinckii]|nr:hypothetical protein [Clostridium beijerinckii]MCI1578966.1 hypothetical protein [Clostridium beijerinckii]MCI1585068.1 hypothetical protein [Clostridium beijerinckii]MCI1624417.1 hypothetical protein [Clostridium beijerinckii]